MEDPRFRSCLDAASQLARGQLPVQVPTSGDDEIARLGRALDDVARRMQRLRDEARLLAAVTRDASRGLILDEVLDEIYGAFQRVLPYERMGLALLSADGREVLVHWARSDAADLRLARGFRAPLAGSSLEEILRTGRPRIVGDLEAYLREHPASEPTRRVVAEGMRSSLTCPLVALGGPVGFLFFSSRARHAYRDAHVETFVQLSAQLSAIVEKSRLYEQILHEQARAEAVLLQVVPASVALRLRAGEQVIADEAADATVLVAAVLGVGALAMAVPAARLVSFLDDLFAQLDRIAAYHGIEKVKTTGDAYLAVAGAPRPRADHARAAASMALDLVELAEERVRPDGEPLAIRVGLHSGPLVAGVIAHGRLGYDLWGDTVDGARRMEATGEPGRIQLSEATCLRLGDGFEVTPRSRGPFVGAGAPRTFWLEGRG